ncbi:MAG: DUF1549 domain-containing protein [Planctomycetales bacterium]
MRDVLSASGDLESNPPVVWFREVTQPTERVEDTAQLFLGLRIQCARCHHHPFEKWSQDGHYGMAAFFSRVGSKKGDGENPRDKGVPQRRRRDCFVPQREGLEADRSGGRSARHRR